MATVLQDDNCPLRAAQMHPECACILNQVSIDKNANKFYLLQVLLQGGHAHVWTRWGRVGAVGQHKLLGPMSEADAVAMFKKVFRDKTGLAWEDREEPPLDGHYAHMKLDVANASTGSNSSGDVTVSTVVHTPLPTTDPSLDPRVAAIVRELCDERMLSQAMAVTYQLDSQRMPLGKLSTAQLDSAEKTLKELDDALLASSSVSHALTERLSSLFWKLVPRATKNNQHLPLITTREQVHELADMLDGLRNIQVASAGLSRSGHSLKDVYDALGVKMEPCDADELSALALMLKGTTSPVHNTTLQLVDALRLHKISQDVRDVAGRFCALSDHRMLFHGSRKSNFMGILMEGLRVPRPDQVSNGSTLGLGIYFADCSTKSAQYCHIDGAGEGFMLLCEVALGTKHVVQGCCSDRIGAPFDCRVAKGMRTVSYVEQDGIWYPKGPVRPKGGSSSGTYSTFQHNEIVAPTAEQYRFRYLLKIRST
jgi:poly [ADP-ribose] polymerase